MNYLEVYSLVSVFQGFFAIFLFFNFCQENISCDLCLLEFIETSFIVQYISECPVVLEKNIYSSV